MPAFGLDAQSTMLPNFEDPAPQQGGLASSCCPPAAALCGHANLRSCFTNNALSLVSADGVPLPDIEGESSPDAPGVSENVLQEADVAVPC